MSQEHAVATIQNLCDIQHKPYTYDDFLKVLKRRLRIFTGMTEVVWYSEIQIATLLTELEILNTK